MIVKYSQIVGAPLLSLDDQKKIGKVLDIVLQKSDISIKGLIVKTGLILPLKKIVSSADIIETTNSAIVVKDESVLLPEKELPQISEAIKKKMFGVSQKVVTKSGTRIGYVYDYTLESESMMLSSIYVKNMLSDRIISRSAISEIEGKKIIIDDDFEIIKNTEIIPETA